MGELKYNKLSEEVAAQIKAQPKGWQSVHAQKDDGAVRRMARDFQNEWRTSYARDCEKILHLPSYNRYNDKTQVFSFYENDDITRRALHVQLVSRAARTIGSVLGLNTDLIEAIALGHDIGHAPFGHAGERFLHAIMQKKCGLGFYHNSQSVRVLDTVYRRNVSLQTLDGILCHNGEYVERTLSPRPLGTFADFDKTVDNYDKTGKGVGSAVTLEGCLVRAVDIVAYLGKDRQDAEKTIGNQRFTKLSIGSTNAEIIHNVSCDLIENSYEKGVIALSEQVFNDLITAKRENYELIYNNPTVSREYDKTVRPMFDFVFDKLLDALTAGDESSPIFAHHIAPIVKNEKWYASDGSYANQPKERIVCDYIASMTDDYFIALYNLLSDVKCEIVRYGYFS